MHREWFETNSVLGIMPEIFRLIFYFLFIVWLFQVKFVVYIGGHRPRRCDNVTHAFEVISSRDLAGVFLHKDMAATEHFKE